MALRTSADNAEDVAAGFRMFREPLPEHATQITSLIADLYSISSSLNSLDDLTKKRTYRHNIPAAKDDLELVRASLKYTLEDIVDFFGDIEVQRGTSREVYMRTWLDLCAYFREESQDSLPTRLAKYKAFLNELEDQIKDKFPDHQLMTGLRNNIKSLLKKQSENEPIAPRLGAMSLDNPPSSSSNSAEPSSPMSDRRPRNRRSYERSRPANHNHQSPTSPSSATFSDAPPSAPDAPGSPVTSTTTTSHSITSSAVVDHWAKTVFTNEITSTRIPYVGESSKCLGEPHPGVKRWLHDEEFEELFQLAFPGPSDLRVHFYLREDDHRARVLCKTPRPGGRGPSDYFCLPLNLLEIIRVGSCLQLCRRRRGGDELVLWANLKFPTIEQMALFFCTFLALRSQDSGRPTERIRDYELQGEEEIFGGQIVDDNYLHALRIYRDNVTGAVRLQASVHKGEMKRAPVWTAFITHHIGTRGWMHRLDSRVLVLRELQQNIFTFNDYNPPQTPRGEHVLRFTSRSDAQGFMETIADLAGSL